MMRIVVLSQPGPLGAAWSRCAAVRLAQQLGVPCITAPDSSPDLNKEQGWVATATIGALFSAMFHVADTAVWLHYSPRAVARAWARGLRSRLGAAALPGQSPRLADVRDSFLHMAWTPHVHRLLCTPALAHLQIFQLRSPSETDFWLRVQEHRLPPRPLPMAGAA
jgi:hypothetical protein